MLDTDTKKQIDNCRDILVGKLPDPKSQVEQITIALIYKFMDDMDKEAEEWNGKPTFFTGEYEKYAWHKIFDPRISSFDMLNLYSESIQKMNQNPKIPQLFRDIFKNAYLPYRDPETLKSFLKEINTFHYSHSEKLGDAFEYLLSVLGSQGDAGQFRTPRHLIDFMVEVIAPQKGETILDPACGTAGFLVSAYKYILKTNTDKHPGDLLTPEDRKRFVEDFNGYDISPDMVRLSLVNLYLHGFSEPRVYEYDTLTSEDHWGEGYDIILANPPFMSPKGGIKPHKRFAIQAKRSEVLFVDYIAEHLNPQGRAAVIVPEGIIFQTQTAYKDLRKMLLEGYFWGIISLPAGVFQPYSGVKTSILLMDKRLVKRTEKVIFLKLDNDGYGLGAQRRGIEQNDLPTALEILNAYKSALFSGQVYDVPEQYQSLAHIITKAKIAEKGDYIISGERFRVTQELSKTKYNIVSIGDIFETSSGGTPLKKNDEYYQKGTIPWLRSGEVSQGYIYSAEILITEEALKNSSAKIFPENTVLVAMYGATAGQVGILKFEACTNQAICGILPNEKAIPEYLYLIVKSQKDYLISLSGGGAQPNISQKIIKELKIPLPPISIQEQIVAEIESYQKIIDGAKQIVENWKPQIKIKEEWDVKELGEICEITSSKRIYQEEYVVEGIPFYRTKEIVELNKGLPISIELFISRQRYEEIKEKFGIPHKGDILVSAVGTIGISWVINDDREFYFKDGNLIWLKDFKEINPLFLQLILEINIIQHIDEIVFGAAYKALTIVKLKELKIPVPSLSEQEVIVSAIEEERAIVERNKRLIEIFEQKIKDKIAEVWGEGVL